MRRQFALLAFAVTAAGCSQNPATTRGVESINVPVISRADYVFDAATPDGTLSPNDAARLDAWFRSMQLGYGDTVYVDGVYADGARQDVSRIAGQYGLLVASGSPVTQGQVAPGSVRVVVTRTRASVPGCPNWSAPSQPNMYNATMSNFGCAVNNNLAAMIANPGDLVSGREGSGVSDAITAARAVQDYRTTAPTGKGGLKDISTKGEE
ncbi:CpaD family pilus assembly protein [Sphingomonas sp. LY29]|uniref:CpaD family pilus assembly protein n=1 Tax=Sphingomonas sp. LY29 TaxID=3095341 RepID=UPI002D773F16|nr:CpaD family pilus assembly protein [Sphingomonas sp. LY29]WRP25836.1 CpaD family pilus assembly protein [Sphingomonas sp. LY29]